MTIRWKQFLCLVLGSTTYGPQLIMPSPLSLTSDDDDIIYCQGCKYRDFPSKRSLSIHQQTCRQSNSPWCSNLSPPRKKLSSTVLIDTGKPFDPSTLGRPTATDVVDTMSVLGKIAAPDEQYHNFVAKDATEEDAADLLQVNCNDDDDSDSCNFPDFPIDDEMSTNGSECIGSVAASVELPMEEDELYSNEEDTPDITSYVGSEETVALGLISMLDGIAAPLYLYDKIRDWLHRSATSLKYDFAERLPSRAQIVNGGYKSLGLGGIKPRTETVQLRGSNNVVDITVHDFTAMVKSLLNDKLLMRKENLLFGPDNPYDLYDGHHDIWTPEDYCYDDINSGERYQELHGELCKDQTRDVLCPLVFFIDKTHTDVHGRLTLEPITFTLGIFNRATRNQPQAWRTLGYIYNQSKHRKSSTSASAQNAIDYHHAMEVILRSAEAVQYSTHRGMPWKLNYVGREWDALLKFPVLFVQGDTEGHDKLCGRYLSRQLNVKRLCRYCTIPTDVIDQPLHHAKHSLIQQKDVEKLVDKNEMNKLKEISQHLLKNAWYRLDFGGCPRGIHGACPAELLHCFQQGLNSTAVDCFFLTRIQAGGIQRPRKKGKGDDTAPQPSLQVVYKAMSEEERGKNFVFTESLKQQLNQFARLVGRVLQHQSDRNIPRTYFPGGISTNAKINAHEQQGVILLIVIALCSGLGWEYQRRFPGAAYNLWVQLLERMIMMEEVLKLDALTRENVDILEFIMPSFLDFYRRGCAREEGNGMKIIKFHLPLHLALDIRRFGSPQNFSGGPGESRHKANSKQPAKLTQKRHNCFEKQTANRQCESIVLQQLCQRDEYQVFASSCSDDESKFLASGSNSVEIRNNKRMGEDGVPIISVRRLESVRGAKLYILFSNGDLCHQLNRVIARVKGYNEKYKHRLYSFLVDYVYKNIVDDYILVYTHWIKKDDDTGEETIYRAHPNWERIGWMDWFYYDHQSKNGQINNSRSLEVDVPARLIAFVSIGPLRSDRDSIKRDGMFDIREPGLYAVAEVCRLSPWGNKTQQRKPAYSQHASHLVTAGTLWCHRAGEDPIVTLIPVQDIKSPCLAVPRNLCLEAGGTGRKQEVYFPNKAARSVEADPNAYLFIRPRKQWPELLLRTISSELGYSRNRKDGRYCEDIEEILDARAVKGNTEVLERLEVCFRFKAEQESEWALLADVVTDAPISAAHYLSCYKTKGATLCRQVIASGASQSDVRIVNNVEPSGHRKVGLKVLLELFQKDGDTAKSEYWADLADALHRAPHLVVSYFRNNCGIPTNNKALQYLINHSRLK